MTHQSRMLLIIGLLSIGGVSALMYMANRYADVLEKQPPEGAARARSQSVPAPSSDAPWKKEATALALARVDQFIGVRSRIRAEIDRRGGRLPDDGAFAGVRASALTDSGMNLSDYGSVREMFRSWREGRLDRSNFMAAAFEQRREALERLDLGDYESLDS